MRYKLFTCLFLLFPSAIFAQLDPTIAEQLGLTRGETVEQRQPLLPPELAEQLGLKRDESGQMASKDPIFENSTTTLSPNAVVTNLPVYERGLAPSSSIRSIELKVGQMHELVFPSAGQIKMKAKQREKFDVINSNNIVYVEPKSLGEATIVFQGEKKSYLLNIKSVPYHVEPFLVIEAPANKKIPKPKPRPKLAVPGSPLDSKQTYYDQVASLISFGARTAYAPKRLIHEPKGANRLPDMPGINLSRASRESRLNLEHLSSWKSGKLFLHILKARNTGRTEINLETSMLRLNTLATAFHYKTLGVNENERTSAIYLVSKEPLNQMLEVFQ